MKYLLLTILFVPTLVIAEPRDLIGQIIDKLIQCESGGRQFAVNNKESHGSSYGVLQYRISTLYHFADRYEIERKDIFDIEFQKDVARKMLEEGRISNWKICSRNL